MSTKTKQILDANLDLEPRKVGKSKARLESWN
jgi:hypothetical protein